MSAYALSSHYTDQVQHLRTAPAGHGPEWWQGRQQSAAQRFAEAGFPDPRQEEWKYTNVRPISTKAFAMPTQSATLTAAAVDAMRVPGLEDVHRLVFLDGHWQADLSSPALQQADLQIESLAAALAREPATLEPVLGTLAHDRYSSFVNANTAFTADGAFIRLGRDVQFDKPIYLLLIGSTQTPATWNHPRILIHAGEGSTATIIEHYTDMEGATGFSNSITELRTEAGAHITHYLLQEHADTAYHIGSLFVQCRRDSQVISHNVNLGGRLVRHDFNVDLAEPGSEVHLNGLFLAGGRQHVDTHTRIHHSAPHTTSREEYRGIGQGHGRGVFKGRVLVERGAQKTNAEQHSANLLLSPHAEIDTKPELEIYADDVKCAHGATVGQLDLGSMYYLRSRGLDSETARAMLVFAFADSVLESMDQAVIREHIEARLAHRLPQTELFADAVVAS